MASNKQIEQFINAIPDKRTAKQIFEIWKNRFVMNRRRTALNATGTITARMLELGVITSTSAAAVTATLDTAANIAAYFSLSAGSHIDFTVDNSAGANTVTVALGTGITAPAGAVTGGNTLTVSTVNKVGVFRLFYTDATNAVIFRLA